MFGWLGNLFIIIGLIMVAYHLRVGFLSGVLGNTFWCIQGILTYQYDLIVIEVIVVVLQLFSYWNWGCVHVRSTNNIH